MIGGALGPRAKGVPPTRAGTRRSPRALDGLGTTRRPTIALVGRRSASMPSVEGERGSVREARTAAAESRRPAGCARRRPRRPARRARSRRPSIGEDAVADPPPSPAMRAAAERGRLLHALFERLPALRARSTRGGCRALAGHVGRRRPMRAFRIARRRCLRDHRRSALRRDLLGRTRWPRRRSRRWCERPCHRRHGRPAAGRADDEVDDRRFQDRPARACRPWRACRGIICARWAPMPRRCA